MKNNQGVFVQTEPLQIEIKMDGDDNEAPPQIEIENGINYQEDQEEFHPGQEDQTI